jgi:hypothetical protein
MSLNKKNKIISIIIIFCIIFLGIFVFNSKILHEQNSPPPFLPLTKGEEKGGGNITLEINDTKYESEIEKEISIYDFMSKLRNEGKIDFTEKNYIGMGKFIISINGTKGNGEQNWIYYVNGKKAQIGVSNYKINPGDVVSWKYEKNY